MNIEIIRSNMYKKIVNDFVSPYSWKKVVDINEFPFEDWNFHEEDMPNEPSLNNFNLIKKITVIYEIDQHIYGFLNIEGIDYIVDVDNEFTIRVVGDTESNWLYDMFDLHDNLDKFDLFIKVCHEKLGIEIKEPDFDKFSKIDSDILEPLIFGDWQP